MKAPKIPLHYKFTESDYAKSLEISGRFFSDDERISNAVTESELHFMALSDEAHRLYCVIKRWPTMRELREHMERQNDAKQTA
jgi:hypothetical protein